MDSLYVLWHYFRNKAQRFNSVTELKNWQNKQIKKALKRITKQIPYYNNYSGKPLNEFPIVDRDVFVTHFDTMNSLGISFSKAKSIAIEAEKSRDFSPMINNISVGLSTGTSGNRCLFLLSKKERLRWSGQILSKALPGSIFKKHKIAFLFRSNNHLYTSVNSQTIQLRFFDLLKPLENTLIDISNFNPDILIGPAHTLSELAVKITSGEIKPFFVKTIISVAEVLEKEDESRIEHAFGTKVHQIYQATEGFLATTCNHGTLHLNEDLLFFEKEYLKSDDGKKRFVPIITDFLRESQAIVRYRLSDLLVEKEVSCPCGSVFQAIDKIEGRCDNIIYLKNKDTNKKTTVFPDVLRCALARCIVEFKEFQIIQTNSDTILVKIDSNPNEKEKLHLKQEIIQSLSNLNLQCPEIQIQAEACFDPRQKFQRVVGQKKQFQKNSEKSRL